MQANWSPFDRTMSCDRIREILNTSDYSYEEVSGIPSRDRLTFTNGFYMSCSALYVDIRESSKLPSRYKRPTLARLYRAYVSEVVALMNGNLQCREINIAGDAVWGVFETPTKADIDYVFGTAAKAVSLVKDLNAALDARNIEPIKVGVGASWGRALMIKAGFKGSRVNDVVWMGDVVNEASHLGNTANTCPAAAPVMVSGAFHGNLSEHNRSLLSYSATYDCYHGYVWWPYED